MKVANQTIRLDPRSVAFALVPFKPASHSLPDCPNVLPLPHLGCQCEPKLVDLCR
jgi:hypothetical protein